MRNELRYPFSPEDYFMLGAEAIFRFVKAAIINTMVVAFSIFMIPFVVLGWVIDKFKWQMKWRD